MRVQDSSRAGHPRDREMDRSFRRRPAAAANNPRGFVHFEDLLGRQAGLVQSRGRDGQAKRLPPDHHAEVSACAERPSARIKASSNFGQGSGELGETRAAGIFGTRRRLFLARKGPGLLPFHNRGLSHAPMRSEEHTSELQSRLHLVCRLLLEKKKKKQLMNTQVDITLRCPVLTMNTVAF